jgi:predicted membrane protein
VARKVDEDLFHQSNVFGDVDIRITSQNFKGGSVSAVFGDCEVDLTGSTIADGEHWLKMNGVFGNARIVVPPDLPVAVLASTVFGDVKVRDERKSGFSPSLTYKSPDYDASHRKLSISVSQVFGSVRVQ